MYLTCLHCNHQSWLEAEPADGLCRCPNCGRMFLTDLPAPSAAPRKAASEVPRLTDRHRCHQCHAEIDIPPEARRCTVTCPECHGRTSAYAIVYRCLTCGRLLASPSAKEGGATTCPACGAAVEVPRDYVFRESDEPVDDDWFAFGCVHCGAGLESKKSAVGQLGVCPHCRRPVRVPRAGELTGEEPRPSPDPLAALGDSTTRHCPHCGLPKPTRAAVCPACGGEDA